MNNVKKTALGLLFAALAFGTSAFTTTRKTTILRYYKTNPITYPAVTNPRGYTYYSDDMCSEGGDLCSALWNIGSHPMPLDGDPLPLASVFLISGSAEAGHY